MAHEADQKYNHGKWLNMTRSRSAYSMLIATITAAGLASRSSLAAYLPDFVAAYAGDTLWALMVFLTLGFIFPRAPTLRLASAALLIAIGVECSQLIDHPFINHIRASWLGAIILGHDFMWSDWLCYATGITAGAIGEIITAPARKGGFSS